MTTAHRPTFHAAIGGKEQGGGRYIAGVSRVHVHDLPGQMSVKKRLPGQGTQEEVRAKDLRGELEQREAEHRKAIGISSETSSRKPPPLPPPLDDDEDDEPLMIDPEDADDKHAPSKQMSTAPDDSEDEDDDDDTEELMRELERIKKERALEAQRKEREAAETEAKERDSAILQGNPLLDPSRVGASSGSFSVKRRWDDDVVFKNQAREPKKEARRFINDTVRNDFHRKFLSRYIK